MNHALRVERLEDRTVPAEVTLGAAKDNTLYEDAEGDVSNAQGEGLFSGRTNN